LLAFSHFDLTYAKTRQKKTITQQDTLLIETASEVCNQVGGIYPVIRSKAPAANKD
jgi:hypothetical protein